MKRTAYFIGTAFLLVLMTAATTAMPLAETQAKDSGSEVDSIADLATVVKRGINPDRCLDKIYVLAFTSGHPNAGSDDDHEIEIRAGGSTRHLVLPDLPGNDYLELKGDLWKLNIADFHFPGCIRIGDIQGIAITEHGNDGWNIDSIATFFFDYNPNTFQLASMDFDVNRWVDGDTHYSHRRFELTLVL